MKQKILYVDIPFTNKQDTESERSLFLWNILSENYDTDLLLIRHPKLLTKQIDKPEGVNQVYALATSDSGFMQAKEVYHFSKENLDTFNQILSSKHYDTILFRQSRCVELVYAAEQILPECNLVIDIDCIFSRQMERAYENVHKKKISKLHPELLKQRKLESNLFSQPYKFLFSHNPDLLSAKACAKIETESDSFYLIPNSQSIIDERVAGNTPAESGELQKKEKFILFFGNLEAQVNQEAFLLIAREIYPRISKSLQAQDIKIYIAGSNKTTVYDQFSGGRIKLMKPEEDISILIRACLFVILPYTQYPDSYTEILMAAKYKKAVLTTHFGQEQIDFPTDDLAIEDDLEAISNRIINLLSAPDKVAGMGIELHQKLLQFYEHETIKTNLLRVLDNPKEKVVSQSKGQQLRLALIMEVFNPEASGFDYNIYKQACELSGLYDVTVFCPRESDSPKTEVIGNVKVYRLWNLFPSDKRKSCGRRKSLCPELMFILLKMDFDLIQLYPGINSNNYLAFIASRIQATPVILCSSAIINYPALFIKDNKINPDILQTITFGWMQRQFLRTLDYICTVSEKEYAYLRKINNRIELVPVPIDIYPENEPHLLREEHNISEDAFVIVCTLPITSNSGQDIALKAFTHALPALPEARLVIISECEANQEYFDELQNYIDKESLHEEVIIHELLEKDEISAWLSAANINLIPSRFLIGDSTALNSWIHGIPVLQSDAVDPNPVIDGYNGYLFCSDDVDDLAMQMQTAYSNREKLAAMAEHGCLAIKDKHTLIELINRYSRIYEQLTT